MQETYGPGTHASCEKCGRKIFITKAVEVSVRDGKRFVELVCKSPSCLLYDKPHEYDEDALEIRGSEPNGPIYFDEHITVRNLGFESSSGKLRLAIDEKHAGVGFYYITVMFESGNFQRIPYDGASPNRDKEPIAETFKPDDTVTEINIVRVHD
jgi:hypothetical protein